MFVSLRAISSLPRVMPEHCSAFQQQMRSFWTRRISDWTHLRTSVAPHRQRNELNRTNETAKAKIEILKAEARLKKTELEFFEKIPKRMRELTAQNRRDFLNKFKKILISGCSEYRPNSSNSALFQELYEVLKNQRPDCGWVGDCGGLVYEVKYSTVADIMNLISTWMQPNGYRVRFGPEITGGITHMHIQKVDASQVLSLKVLQAFYGFRNF